MVGHGLNKESQSDKNHFEEWAQMTGWHGVLDFIYAKTILLKCVWGIIIGLGCFLAISQSYSLLCDFLEEDQWVTSVTYESPEGDVLDWPNFTICNLNWLAKSKLDKAHLLHDPYSIEYVANLKEGVEFYRLMQDDDHVVDNADYEKYAVGSDGATRAGVGRVPNRQVFSQV